MGEASFLPCKGRWQGEALTEGYHRSRQITIASDKSPSTTATRRSPSPSQLGEEWLDQILPIFNGEGTARESEWWWGRLPPHTHRPHQPCGLPLFC